MSKPQQTVQPRDEGKGEGPRHEVTGGGVARAVARRDRGVVGSGGARDTDDAPDPQGLPEELSVGVAGRHRVGHPVRPDVPELVDHPRLDAAGLGEVARTADPALDRQTTVEVTATIVEE